MARRIRFIPPGGCLVEVTTRALQGRYLLRPSLHLNELIVGILARAQRRWPVRLHGAVFMSNHYHLLLTVETARQLSGFMHYVNGQIAREVCRLYSWKDRVWSRRYVATLVSVEEAAQVGRFRYLLAHGAKENLVASPREWPGVHCAKVLATGGSLRGVWIDRTLQYEAERSGKDCNPTTFRETYRLTFDPLPCWANLDPSAYQTRVESLLRDVEAEAKEACERRGLEPLGLDKILRQSPQALPNRVKKSPAPLVHAASKAVRKILRDGYRVFLGAYRIAAEKLRSGDRSAEFPVGCFPPALPFVEERLPLPAT